MAESPDIWSEWLLKRRFGGDAAMMRQTLEILYPVRDRVLQNAGLSTSDVLLDVGCGDGLIGFGAIQSHEDCSVVFSDISQDLLVHTRALATEANVVGRTHFLRGSAECLPLSANSVDAITTRSVLIYVDDKAQAFEEFCRVLRPSGRLSIFEPINRFDWPEPEHIFFGYDVTPVMDVTKKVKSLYARLQPMDSDPMMNFDERDLLHLAEATGFTNIHLQFDVAM
jgi:arsenite methyltransferase